MSRYNYGRFIRQLCIKHSYLKQGGGGGNGCGHDFTVIYTMVLV